MADLLFILFGFSYFACVESASESALRVWLNPNLSNRRSAVQWYFPLSWVFSDLWINLSLDQPVYPYLYQFICPFISLYLSTADRIALVFSCSKLIVVVFAVRFTKELPMMPARKTMMLSAIRIISNVSTVTQLLKYFWESCYVVVVVIVMLLWHRRTWHHERCTKKPKQSWPQWGFDRSIEWYLLCLGK